MAIPPNEQEAQWILFEYLLQQIPTQVKVVKEVVKDYAGFAEKEPKTLKIGQVFTKSGSGLSNGIPYLDKDNEYIDTWFIARNFYCFSYTFKE